VLTVLLALVAPSSAVEPVRIKVPDPSVSTVVLDCGGNRLESPVRSGVAVFENVGDCSVHFIRQVGQVAGPGEYTCDGGGCRQVDVIHRQVDAAPGRVTIIITDKSTDLLELRCPSGYRNRASVDQNTAVFDGVPDTEDCDMFWKGGSAPAKARQIRPGTWYCQQTGSTGICKQR
jgi:hypothetical protein